MEVVRIRRTLQAFQHRSLLSVRTPVSVTVPATFLYASPRARSASEVDSSSLAAYSVAKVVARRC